MGRPVSALFRDTFRGLVSTVPRTGSATDWSVGVRWCGWRQGALKTVFCGSLVGRVARGDESDHGDMATNSGS